MKSATPSRGEAFLQIPSVPGDDASNTRRALRRGDRECFAPTPAVGSVEPRRQNVVPEPSIACPAQVGVDVFDLRVFHQPPRPQLVADAALFVATEPRFPLMM